VRKLMGNWAFQVEVLRGFDFLEYFGFFKPLKVNFLVDLDILCAVWGRIKELIFLSYLNGRIVFFIEDEIFTHCQLSEIFAV
jgi:hypothetical protein